MMWPGIAVQPGTADGKRAKKSPLKAKNTRYTPKNAEMTNSVRTNIF